MRWVAKRLGREALGLMSSAKPRDSEIDGVEASVLQVYDYCPPTVTHYTGDGRAQYEREWGTFLTRLGLAPESFVGKSVLDVGCGSCEKASFYHDWGASVTGLEMTPSVLDRARQVICDRDIKLVHGSVFKSDLAVRFDVVIADGMLHHTADTFAALAACIRHVNDDGYVLFGLVNVWGSFWWFSVARAITRALGGSDFHRRAAWGRRLFGWTRRRHEWARESGAYYRALESWAYDWFGNPRWNLHSPREVLSWLPRLGLVHVASVPSLVEKTDSRTLAARLLRVLSGNGTTCMGTHWLLNRAPNMFYVCARRDPTIEGEQQG